MKRWDEAVRRLPADRPTIAAEVGVWRGKMSEQLLAQRPQLTLLLVDLWRAGRPGDSWFESGSKMARESQASVDAVLAGVEKIAKRYAPRARIIRAYSTIAAEQVPDASLDLVFLDADHSQLAVLADIQAWRPKVRPGGWIGGHDYGSKRFAGVEGAVLQAFRRAQVETGANSTWWVRL